MQTRIVHIAYPDTEHGLAAIAEAGKIIRDGGLVVFPTETVYGLGGDATNPLAASRIYAAKGRPSDNPLIIHLADASDVSAYAVTCPLFVRFAEAFMPGPLTVILPVRPNIPKEVTAGLSTVAVRIPRHPVARALIRAAGVPIAAPSANLSGSPSPTSGDHVIADLDGRVDMIIDGGDADIGLESTIVKIEDDSSVTLLRPGGITIEDLKAIGCTVKIAKAVTQMLEANEKVLSPGMKYKHYAPKAPLTLLGGASEARMIFLQRRIKEMGQENKKCAVIVYREEIGEYTRLFPETKILNIGSLFDENEQAKRLFACLRQTDFLAVDEIYAPRPGTVGMGLALYNRMIRAAAHRIIDLDSINHDEKE